MGEILRYKLYALYILLGFTLVQYQNCAPSSETLDSSLQIEDAGATPVDSIDQVNVGAISFAQNKVSAFLDQNVVVMGVCGQSGSLISWTLVNANGEFIERGLAECDTGSFEVALSDSWQSYCDQDLSLKAALGAKATSETVVEAYCE